MEASVHSSNAHCTDKTIEAAEALLHMESPTCLRDSRSPGMWTALFYIKTVTSLYISRMKFVFKYKGIVGVLKICFTWIPVTAVIDVYLSKFPGLKYLIFIINECPL